MPPQPPQPGKRRTSAIENGGKLHQHAAQIQQRCPGTSTIDSISFLTLIMNKTNGEFASPCTANGTQLCHILDHLTAYNECLQLIDMELKEVEPGEFGLCPLGRIPRHQQEHAGGGPCVRGWSLLHWLLQEHRCIKTLTVPRGMSVEGQVLLSDSLHLHPGLNKLTLRSWAAEAGLTNIISAIGTVAQLEELDLGLVSLPPSALGDLGNALGELSSLKTLALPSIEGDLFSLNHFNWVMQLVRALKCCSKLEELSCHDYVLELECGDAFAEFVAESHSLKKLSLCQSLSEGDELHELFTAVGRNNGIEELNLDGFLLFEEDEALLAKVVAQHTGLRRLEVGLFGIDCMDWENDGAALADMVGRNTGLRELVFVGGTVDRLPAFAAAILKNRTMEKLTLGLFGMDVPDYRLFLEALACNASLQLVTFEEFSNSHFNDIILLTQATGTEGRLAINASVDDPHQLEGGLRNSTSLTKVKYRASVTTSPVPHGTFRHLLHHQHLQELSICLNDEIHTESASSLGLFLATTKSLKSVTLEFLANPSSSLVLVEGLTSNTSLTSLTIAFWTFEAPEADMLWHMLGSSKTLTTLSLELVDFGRGVVHSKVPDGLLNNHYLLEATLQQNPVEIERLSYNGIRGDIRKRLTFISTQKFQFGIEELTRRNLSTLHRAVQFVMGSHGRRFAEAFERVSEGLTLVEALKKAIGESEDQIKTRIASSTRYLDEHFLAEAGVVRDRVVCGEGSRVQLDRIGIENWLHIRQYLKVTDIVLEPDELQVGPSSSKKHCRPTSAV